MGSRELAEAAERAVEELQTGKISCEEARVRIAGLKVIGMNHAQRLEHAKLTGRLVNGSDELPDYTSPPKKK